MPVYVINSYVWLHAPPPKGVSPKLHRYWTGPWQIKGITGTTVDLTRVGPLPSPRHMRSTSVHVDRIKPVRGTVTLAPAAPPVSQSTPVEESVPAPFTVNQPTRPAQHHARVGRVRTAQLGFMLGYIPDNGPGQTKSIRDEIRYTALRSEHVPPE